MKKLQNGLENVWAVLIIVLILVVVGYLFFIKKPNSVNQQTAVIECPAGQVYSGSKCVIPEPGTINLNMSGGKDVTKKYKTYSNSNLRISFEYPSSWGEPVLTTTSFDISKCQSAETKTYKPNYYRPTNKITFSNRNQDSLYVNLINFSQNDPNGCDDGGIVNLVEKRNNFMNQPLGITEETNGWKSAVSKNNHGNVFTYYPDYYNSIGTSIDQIYEMFGPNLLVQAWILHNPSYGSPEFQEAQKYDCTSDQKYGTCGLTKWLREGQTSLNLREDFDGLDHLIKTFKFI